MTDVAATARGLPDPDAQPDFYADTPLKRALAWCIDVVAIAALTLVALPLTLFTGLFFLPLLYLTVGVLYRTVSLSWWSATPGMRLMSMELRDGNGERFDLATAAMHTGGYTASVMVFPLQLISVVLMATTARRQGLSDHALGTAALNRAALTI